MGFNKKYNENDHNDDLPSVDADTGETIKEIKTKSSCYAVYDIFKAELGKYPLNWKVNKAQRTSAENLSKERGEDAIRNALKFYKEHQDDEFCPKISSPFDLDSKWTKLASFKKKNGL